MSVADQFANFASTTIAGGAGGAGTPLNAGDTSVLLATGSGALFPSVTPFMVLINTPTSSHELAKCTARVSDTLTIVRAQEGTSAQTWPVGTLFQSILTAGNLSNLWTNVTNLNFDVKSYGAVGNGVTDDTASINNAIQAAVAAGGGIVFFPIGTYLISGTLLVNGDNILLRGSGWGTVIKPVSNATFDVIATGIPTTVGTSGYVRNYLGVEHLKIDGSNMSGTVAGQGNGIHWYGVRYSYIDRVFFNKIPNWAALLDGDNTAPGSNFGYDNVISRCKFDLCNANIYFTNCEGNDVIDNRIDWAGSATAAAQPVFGSTSTYANHIQCSSGYNYIAGNVIGKGGTYTTPAILLSNSGPCRVIGNRFDQVRNQAVVMNAGNHEFAFNALGSPGSASSGVPGIQIGSSRNRVVGNSFDTTAGGTNFTYAVAESGGPFSGNIITNNLLLAGTAGVISLNNASTDIVNNNVNAHPAAVYNARDYGATGNGATDDTAAIQAAINAAVAAGGGLVYLQAGTYVTSAMLSLGGDNVVLRGDGWNTIIKPISGALFDVIGTPVPATQGTAGYVRQYLMIDNLMIDCSNMTATTAGQGNGIHLYGSKYGVIRRIFVKACKNWAVLLDGDATNFGFDNVVEICVFDTSAAGIYVTNCEANDIQNNRFKYATTACAAAQPAFGTQDTTALHLRCSSGYNYIAGNVFGKSGTYMTEAIRLSSSGPCRVIGNRFDQVRNQAVVMNGGNHEFAFNALGSPGSAATGVPAIQIGSSNNRIVGNGFDTTAGGANFSYAIAESGGPFNNNIIADNATLAGTAGVISLNALSNDKVHHNANYNPLSPLAAPAAPTLATATTGGTVAAGTYGVELTYVNAFGETVASASASISPTGTTSTITITAPTRVGNASGWYAYVTQAGGSTYTRQQASPTAMGTNLVLTAPPTSTGANPPGSNTTAGFATPAMPASGVTYINTFGVDCAVSITGGTVSQITIGGINLGWTNGYFRLPAGGSISITYSAAPTWIWLGE